MVPNRMESNKDGGEKADLAEFLTRQGDATVKMGDLIKDEISKRAERQEDKPEEAAPAPEPAAEEPAASEPEPNKE